MNTKNDSLSVISVEIPEEKIHKLAYPIKGVYKEWKEGESPCIICTSHKTRDGKYPRVGRKGRDFRVHKYLFLIYKGEIPEGMVVRHRCDRTRCINIDHLELGWPADNSKDAVERGRQAKGEKCGMSKLTNDQAYYIKFEATESVHELATRYRVKPNTIQQIRNGNTWAWLNRDYYKDLNSAA